MFALTRTLLQSYYKMMISVVYVKYKVYICSSENVCVCIVVWQNIGWNEESLSGCYELLSMVLIWPITDHWMLIGSVSSNTAVFLGGSGLYFKQDVLAVFMLLRMKQKTFITTRSVVVEVTKVIGSELSS